MDWKLVRAADFIDFNPQENVQKGAMTKKVAMEQLRPFTRDVLAYEVASFNGGSKFRNGDTLMARITPCLENGKTAQVNILDDGEIGFGSTEFIVLRAKPDVSDKDFIYYLAMSPILRDKAINSMVGSSGRQRVQQGFLNNTEFLAPSLDEQIEIGHTLRVLDDKIANNTKINNHLEKIAQTTFERILIEECSDEPMGVLSDIAEINPIRTLNRGQDAIYVEMANLPTHSSFPTNWAIRSFSGGMKFTNGDTIMARITPCLENGKTAYISFLKEGAVAFGSTEYIIITSKPGYCNEMFYFLARYPDFVNYAVRNMNGSSGRQRVSGDTIGRYELHIPKSENVISFAKIASPIMETIRQNALESRNLAILRDALLPRLMSGELLSPDLDGAK